MHLDLLSLTTELYDSLIITGSLLELTNPIGPGTFQPGIENNVQIYESKSVKHG